MAEHTLKLSIKTRTGNTDKMAAVTFTVEADSSEEAFARLKSAGARIMNYDHAHIGERVESYRDGQLAGASERVGSPSHLVTVQVFSSRTLP